MKENFVDFSQLSASEIAGLAEALQYNEFEISGYEPSGDNHPEGLLDIFTTQHIYSYLLNDEQATFAYFSIRFHTDTGKFVQIPVGVYGISAANQISYPLIASGYLRDFLDVSKPDFSNIMNMDAECCHMAYGKLLDMRSHLMKKIFAFYRDIDHCRNAFMAWKMRNKESSTRQAAESVLYRIEYPNAGIEFYHSRPADDATMAYIIQCLGRWEGLSKDFSSLSVETPKYDNETENMKQFPFIFYSSLIPLQSKSL